MGDRILLYHDIDPCGTEILQNAGLHIDVAQRLDEDYLVGIAADYDAILVRGMGKLPGRVLEQAQRCRVVSRHGVGLETIDVATATNLCIPVTNTPGANMNAVAEQAVALMLDVLKNTCYLVGKMKIERDYNVRLQVTNHEISGRVLGLLGLGNIGRRVGEICARGFGMRVIGYDPYVSARQLREMGSCIESIDHMDQVIRTADILSLHAPGGAQPLIGRRELDMMKPGSVLINTSRGSLIDEDALADALRSGHLMGAGLDVMAQEPPPAEHPFYHMDNVVLLPHTAALTREGNKNMAQRSAKALVQVLEGHRPEGLVNPEIWDQRRR